jgi:hypothetical protein
MKYRKLRIAWSIGCCVMAVLLIVLWVRSYWIRDSVWLPGNEHGVQINSLTGHFAMFVVARHSPTSQFTPAQRGHDRIAGKWKDLFDNNMLGFYFERDGRELRLDVPHWFCMLAVILVGAAPWWLSWRFSLRTLLISITLVALALGTIIATTR